jgi:hypothetical protein
MFRVLLPENSSSTWNFELQYVCTSLFSSTCANYFAKFIAYILFECFSHDWSIPTCALFMFSLGFHHDEGDWARLSLGWNPQIRLGLSKPSSLVSEIFRRTYSLIMLQGRNLFVACKSVQKSKKVLRKIKLSWNSAVFRLNDSDRIGCSPLHQSLKYVQSLVPVNFKLLGRLLLKIRLEFYSEMTTAFTFIFANPASPFGLTAGISHFYILASEHFQSRPSFSPFGPATLQPDQRCFWYLIIQKPPNEPAWTQLQANRAWLPC